MSFFDRFHFFHKDGSTETFYRDSTGGFSSDRGNAIRNGFFGPEFIKGGGLSPVGDAFIEAFGLPVIFFILFIVLLASIEAVGKNGLVPFVALVAAYIIAIILSRFIPSGVLFAWLQPFVVYCAFIFSKYTFLEDGALGLLSWLIYAMIELIILAATGMPMAYSWGIIYLFPYACVFFWTISDDKWIYVHYMIVYMALMAIVISLIQLIIILMAKDKQKVYDAQETQIWPGIIVFVLMCVAYIHPMVREYFDKYTVGRIEADFAKATGVTATVGKVIMGVYNWPPTHALGKLINRAVEILAGMG